MAGKKNPPKRKAQPEPSKEQPKRPLKPVIEQRLKMCIKKTRRIHPKVYDYLDIGINLILKECVLRAAKQAISEDEKVVTSEHVAKILPQMLLDS